MAVVQSCGCSPRRIRFLPILSFSAVTSRQASSTFRGLHARTSLVSNLSCCSSESACKDPPLSFAGSRSGEQRSALPRKQVVVLHGDRAYCLRSCGGQ